MNSQQLIERLQTIQDKAGHAVEVAVSIGDELSNVEDVMTAGVGDEQIAVIRFQDEWVILDSLAGR